MRHFDLLIYYEGRATGGVTGILDGLRHELPGELHVGIVCSPAAGLRSWRAEVQKGGWEVLPRALSNRAGLTGWLEVFRMIALVRLFRRARIVHFHQHTPFSCLQAIACGRIARTPALIATEHYVPLLNFLRRKRLPAILGWIREVRIWLQMASKRLTLHSLRTIVFVSHASLETFQNAFGRTARPKLAVVPNGITIGSSEEDRGEASRRVRALFGQATIDHVAITVAALNNQKGHAFLLQAVPAVLAQHPSTGFLCVGDGHLRNSLEQAITGAGLQDHVVFTGERRDVRQLLEGSDLFVLPSLFEGLPLSVLEAMAAGCPVVATAVDGTGEAVLHEVTGLLVPPRNPRMLAEAIIRLLDQPPYRAQLARAARRRVESEFSSTRMGLRYIQEYEALLSDWTGRTP